MNPKPGGLGTPHTDSIGERARVYISSNLARFVAAGLVGTVGFIAIATSPEYRSLSSALINGLGAGLAFSGITFFFAGVLAHARKLRSAPSPSLNPRNRSIENILDSSSAPTLAAERKISTTRTGGILNHSDAPIFVVHGHARAILYEVVRVIERGTGREVIILHEQVNSGRTILEKFERHAATAAYAVVLLTGDDEGRLLSTSEPRVRGRQNVIFELGFFFGKLGRERVTVLVDRDVEKPSDVEGLVYIPLDHAGAWKQSLARELQGANIQVNYSRIP